MRLLLTTVLWLLAASPIFLATSKAWANSLTVYTYDSFVAEWGPGPKIKAAFEETCNCTLNLVGLADAVAILGRLKFEGEATQADIVLGLDKSLIAEARETGLFTASSVDTSALTVPGGWADKTFLPYDYGYFAFIYDKTALAAPPQSLAELVEGTATVIIQDPRSSSPGLGLMLWMRKIFGDDAAGAWARLAPRIVTVTSGWSESYGLFLKGEADMVLSYSTSPAYHITEENDHRYQAAAFSEGHYIQVETAARLARSHDPGLAEKFLTFLVSQEAQAILPATQWMYPVRDVKDALPPAFSQLIEVSSPLSFTSDEVMAGRAKWVAEWRDALSR
ncbi:Thiamin ABC transporter, substrate-binding component [hydrothermal vent metagenome]|uniref:Thiamine-binding periplasmic protein n=1 Tax=hydrothermal vent metagenome TaxID=652676 RepID=A0A3B0U7Y4_9ZZZZ